MKNYGKRIAEYMPWLLLTGCVEGICILFLALADVQVLQVLAGVLTLMTVLMYAGVCIYIVKKEQKKGICYIFKGTRGKDCRTVIAILRESRERTDAESPRLFANTTKRKRKSVEKDRRL